MNEQPFWYERYGKEILINAERVHNYGLYLPNNPDMSEDDIEFICEIVNKTI